MLGNSLFEIVFSICGTLKASRDSGLSYNSSVHLENGSGNNKFLKGIGLSASQAIHLSLITLMKYIGCIISYNGTVNVNYY